MWYLLTEIVSIALFVGFIVFASYEQRAGERFLFAYSREWLDRKIEKELFVCRHVDVLAFLKDTVRLFFEHGLHGTARIALRAVRFIERRLSNLVHILSEKFSLYNAPSGHPTVKSKSPFIQSISGYKQELRKDKGSHELSQ